MSYGDRIRRLREAVRGLNDEVLPDDERHLVAIIDEVMAERLRQQQLRPADYDLTAADWISRICAYAGQAAPVALGARTAPRDFRSCMVKVAALSLAAIEAVDQK